MTERQSQGKRDLEDRTFQFAVRIVKLCQTLDSSPSVSRALANQLLRSGTSVGANVAEGQGGQSRADFVSKYSIANKEARETLYWLKLIVAAEIVPESRLAGLMDECNQLIGILTTIIKKTRKEKQAE
jgi:four helix bundle protein